MIAEVKAFGASNRRDARAQLDDAEIWAETLGVDEVIRVGANDDSGEPQLANPYDLNDGTLDFETSGVIELPYPGMIVVYRLTEPGVYEYRLYATEPLPDPTEPRDDDSTIRFSEQLENDYDAGQAGRQTPEMIYAEREILETPVPR